MTATETKWSARVREWRDSGLTLAQFCEGREFTPNGLRYWVSRFRKGNAGGDVRLARIVKAADPAEESPVVIEAGPVRIGVRRGFDPEVLRTILALVSEPAG